MMTLILSSLINLRNSNNNNNQRKNVVKVGPPLTKFSGSAHEYSVGLKTLRQLSVASSLTDLILFFNHKGLFGYLGKTHIIGISLTRNG